MNSTGTDLDVCAAEPIRIPGAIQTYGALLVLRAEDLAVSQVSANLAAFTGIDATPGSALTEGEVPFVEELRAWQESGEAVLKSSWPEKQLSIVAHRSGSLLLVEFERLDKQALEGLLPRLTSFAEMLGTRKDIQAALETGAKFIATLSGFDRVLIYRFDDEWNGQVVAEAGNGNLPSYLDLRFPAGDIPAQARQLYTINRVRIIPDADYVPVPLLPEINPETGTALDMSFSQVRSVSPVHIEYMRNMGTLASMSVSIIVDGKLWGLVACHSARPHVVPTGIRDACDFAAQSMALRIAADANATDAERRVELGRILGNLLTSMSEAETWYDGLAGEEQSLLDQVGATGAALVVENRFFRTGKAPAEADIAALVEWLDRTGDSELFSTDNLEAHLPQASVYASVASGIIAVRISELHASWLIWFRPGLEQTVTWGGDPHKSVREKGRIHPRQSFVAWKQLVRNTSAPWSEAELSAARDLRRAILGIVLRKAEEMAALTGELQRSNKELEAFSYSISHDLRAPFRHIVGFAQLLSERGKGLDEKSQHYINMISDAALGAGRLVDDLLHFSQLGRASLVHRLVDMDKLVEEVKTSICLNLHDRQIEWRIGPLPAAWGDATLLRQVWYNLIENAVKYSRPRPVATIEVAGVFSNEETTYTVRDNGVGFDMAYYGKLFGVFQRLQRAEDYEGTGIGLALARRIVERHGGSIFAESKPDEGATFSFILPAHHMKEQSIA